MISDKTPKLGQLSALIVLRNTGMTQLHGDWRNHAREATSPSGGCRPSSRVTVLEWRTQATFNNTLCINSALHLSGVAKSSTSFGRAEGGNVTSALR